MTKLVGNVAARHELWAEHRGLLVYCGPNGNQGEPYLGICEANKVWSQARSSGFPEIIREIVACL